MGVRGRAARIEEEEDEEESESSFESDSEQGTSPICFLWAPGHSEVYVSWGRQQENEEEAGGSQAPPHP